jgi:hypothetical protein
MRGVVWAVGRGMQESMHCALCGLRDPWGIKGSHICRCGLPRAAEKNLSHSCTIPFIDSNRWYQSLGRIWRSMDKLVTPPRSRKVSLSPVPCWSCHSGREVVIERVVEKSTAVIIYPILTRTNYSEWALVMWVNLQAAVLRDIISKGTNVYREDRNALVALLRAVPQDIQATLAVKDSTKEA